MRALRQLHWLGRVLCDDLFVWHFWTDSWSRPSRKAVDDMVGVLYDDLRAGLHVIRRIIVGTAVDACRLYGCYEVKNHDETIKGG